MEQIYEVLSEIRPEFDYHQSNNFIKDGLLDSFDVISLVTSLEDVFNIQIGVLDILPEYFCNIEKIIEVIRKNGGSVT